MKLVLLLGVVTVANADHHQVDSYGIIPSASTRAASFEPREVVPILKDERIQEADGRYNYEIETGDGIRLSQSGSPDASTGAVIKAGEFSYTAPDGTLVITKFVANENGYQPEGDHLPVAPEFPHPIPQFVLNQIAKAEEEDAAAARAESAGLRSEPSVPAPSYTYRRPQ